MITSKENNLIKLANSIKQKKHSRETGLCFVESIKIVKELYNKNFVEQVLVTQDKLKLVNNFKCKIEVISDNIAKYLSDSVTTDGVFAIVKIKNPRVSFDRCLILDRIQDPSNIGAIVRSACAFGFKKIFAINSVYPYSFKCIRSSMGYIFDIDYNEISLQDLIKIKNDNNLKIICADMSGESIETYKASSEPLAIVIGNEGQGVDEELFQIADKTIKIPMQNAVESLNASVSAGIIMFNLKK